MLWFLKGYIRVAAIILAIAGLAMLYTATGGEKLQQAPDALLGFTSGTTLVIAGALQLIYSAALFFVQDLLTLGLLTFWLGLNYIVYHAGMILARASFPFPMVQLLAWKFGSTAQIINNCWNLFTAYLLMGSVLYLMLEWRRHEQLYTESYLKQWAAQRDSDAVPTVVTRKA